MKSAVASFALAVMLCGRALGQEAPPPFPAPGERPHSPMMNQPEGPLPRMRPHARREWWKDPEAAQKLQLSDEQVGRIEKIARDHQLEAIDLRATLEKQEVTLRSLMGNDPPDESQVLAQIDKVAQARADLEKSRVRMTLAVQRVLTPEQSKKLRGMRHAPPPQGGPEWRHPDGPMGPPPGNPPQQPQEPEKP